MSNDRIEKETLLESPRPMVWAALTNSQEFGAWFGMKLKGPFKQGQTIHGEIAPTTVDSEVAKMQEPHKGKAVELYVERIEPESKFCLKWHPFAIDPKTDYSAEPMTLITFSLKEIGPGKTMLNLTEAGFEKLPLSRRTEAIQANDGGWSHQMILLRKYLSQR